MFISQLEGTPINRTGMPHPTDSQINSLASNTFHAATTTIAGEPDMRIQMITAVAVTSIGLGMTPALAQSGPHIGSYPTPAQQQRDRPEPGGLGYSPKWTPGPALSDGVVPVERAVCDRGSYFQHQVGTPRRPAHLLLSVHSAMQQPLHRALGDRRRNRFFASARCRVIDDDIGLSGHVCLQIA
jgi:hypothetical protein